MRLFESKQPNRVVSLALLLLTLFACSIAVVTPIASSAGKLPPTLQPQTAQSGSAAQTKPLPAPARWRGLIGEYGPDNGIVYIIESDGKLCASFKRGEVEPLDEVSRDVFK